MAIQICTSLRRFSYLVRLEAREARGITALVLGLSLMVTFGAALFAQREAFVLTFEVEEALALAVLAFAAFMPVLADVVAGSESRSARRAMASLPVSSGTAFAAQVVTALGAAAVLYGALCLGWVIAVVVLDSPTDARLLSHGWEDLGGVAAALVGVGALVLPLAAVAVTCFVAQVFRHAGAATIAGWVTVLMLFAVHFDAGIMNLGTRFAHFPAFATAAASSPWTYPVLLLAFGSAYRLRGSANRSWFARTWRIALVLGLSSGAAAGAVRFQEWRRFSYDFYDSAACISNPMPPVLRDGRKALIQLSKNDSRTFWLVDLMSQSAERISEGRAVELFWKSALSPLHRDLERQRMAIVREHTKIGDDWHRAAYEERWTSNFGGPAVVVQAEHVFPPRRRLPGIAFYFDMDKRLHRVDLHTGKDQPTKHVVDGNTLNTGIDEEGRWMTWHGADDRFHGVEIESGRRVEYIEEQALGHVYGSLSVPSFCGNPVLRCLNDDGPSHATIQNGAVVPLPLSRRYYHLIDVDGESLLGVSEDNGLYLLGPNCEEVAVLREPMPDALPKRP